MCFVGCGVVPRGRGPPVLDKGPKRAGLIVAASSREVRRKKGGTYCRRSEANGEAVPASWCGGLSFPPSAPSAPYPHGDGILASVGGRR